MASHVVPSLAELGRMSASAHYAPIYREVLADVETPVSALRWPSSTITRRIKAARAPPT